MNDKTQRAPRNDGALPPIYADPEYPELLRDVARLLETGLVQADVDPQRAAALVESVVEHARTEFGGIPQYWPKGEPWRVRVRRAQMWDAFNGRNHAELAKLYGMSLSQVYRTLALARQEFKQRTEGQLFPDAGVEGAGAC